MLKICKLLFVFSKPCICLNISKIYIHVSLSIWGERGGSVVECRTPEREVRGSRPTSAVLCPWARHFTPRKYWLITQEAMAPSRHDWKIVDWDVKPQHNQPTVNMIDRLDITDEYSVKCVFILNVVIFIDAALNIPLRKNWKCNVL